MKIYFLPEFIEDLKSLDNVKTLTRVLEKFFDSRFEFKKNRDDHRYDGVEDAWIRDISKGVTAYRSIYIQKDDKVYLYRTGTKKIEQNLAQPNLNGSVFELTEFKVEIVEHVKALRDEGKLLRSPNPSELFAEIMRFSHVELKEIIILSPLVSKELFNNTSHFGRFINKALENQTAITLITKPPRDKESIDFFDDLETKGMLVLYNDNLNARMWYFDVNVDALSRYSVEEGYTTSAILGSASLTSESLAIDTDEGDIELCYKIPTEKNEEFYGYCNKIYGNSIDHTKYKRKQRWQ